MYIIFKKNIETISFAKFCGYFYNYIDFLFKYFKNVIIANEVVNAESILHH